MCISSQELSEIQSVSMETKFPTFKLVFKSSVKWLSTEDYIIDQRHSAQCKQDQEKKNIQVQVIYLIGTFPICTSGFLSPADQPFFFFFSLKSPSRLTYKCLTVRYLEVTRYFECTTQLRMWQISQDKTLCKHHFHYSFPTVTQSVLRRALQMSPSH